MTQAVPAPSDKPSETTGTPTVTPTETVVRPDPGLASGRWEAPRWAFALVAALTLLGGLVWLAVALRTRRMGS